jgi:ABC-type branched-subunit amino acid transport system ATPase component
MLATSARLEIKRLTRQFNGACVVDDVSLSIQAVFWDLLAVANPRHCG